MQSPSRILKLGTRGSPLAMAQAKEVRAKLCAAHGWDKDAIEIVTMKTTGDQFTNRPLSAIGGKGLFTKELEIGLYDKAIDFAVHSTKDVATILPDGLKLIAILKREDMRDAFVSLKHASIAELPKGAIVGTSSLRRKAQLLRIRPDLDVVEFRGTVETRLEKLRNGVAEASFLAMAGLKRLGREDLFSTGTAHPISEDELLPAAAQGAISIEIRQDDDELAELLMALDHAPTHRAVLAERAFLRELDGSCRTPIAALAKVEGDNISLRGEVLSLDGSKSLQGEWQGSEPIALGEEAGLRLLEQGAADVLG